MSTDSKRAKVTTSHDAILKHLLQQAFLESNPYLAQALFAETRAWLDRSAATDDHKLGFEVEARKAT